MTDIPIISFEHAISYGPVRAVHMGQRSFAWESVARVNNVNNDPLSHLPAEEASEAAACHQWACEFALHPYKCHEQSGSSQNCKPTLKTRLFKHNLQQLFLSDLPMRFGLPDEELRDVIKHKIFASRRGQYLNPPSKSPFGDVLWDAVKEEVRRSIVSARTEGRLNVNGDLVLVQADNRPCGKGNNAQEDPTYQLFYNFNGAVGAQLGLLIRFQTNRFPFNSYSPFWIATLVFSCVVGIFQEADVVYMDTDLCIFPTSFTPRLNARPYHDTLHAATDVNSPINAGFICVLRGTHISHRTLEPGLDPTCWNQRRLLCQERLQPFLLNKTLPLSQTLLAFSTETLWTIETWEASASVLLSAVWGTTGFDRLRPRNVEEALLLHALFSIFGSLHWPTGAQRLHATPIVDGNDDAIQAVEWARNVYEQLTLYWVALATDATNSDVFCIHSGEGGMMVNQHMDYLPHIDIDECLHAPDFQKIFMNTSLQKDGDRQ